MRAPEEPVRANGNLRQVAAFASVGVMALLIDAGVLSVLTSWLGFPALAARIPSIATAMVCAWIANRTITFRGESAPSFAEFGRYATVAGVSAVINYAVYWAVLVLRVETPVLIAMLIASAVAAAVSFVGYRWFAFRAASI